MDWPTSNSMVFSRQGQPSISQGEVIQKLLYHHLRNFTRNSDFTWRGVWLWRISGGYSQEMMGLVLQE